MITKFIAMTQAYIRCQKGATAIEYGLIAAGIAVAISSVVFLVGTDLKNMFTGIGSSINTATATMGS